MKNKLKVAISTCPNDTFMFYHFLYESDLCREFDIELTLCDIEELNQIALSGAADICKTSFGLYPKIAADYKILDSGSALGWGCGPLLISRPGLNADNLKASKLAIPGFNTSAYQLLQHFYGQPQHVEEMLFSDIMPSLLQGKIDFGLIIHESRFTYEKLGLNLIADLGNLWEKQYDLPLPLGAIVVKKSIEANLACRINWALNDSVAWAFDEKNKEHPDFNNFIARYADEMENDVLHSHIKTYVTEESLSLSHKGREAVVKLLSLNNPHQAFVTDDLFVK